MQQRPLFFPMADIYFVCISNVNPLGTGVLNRGLEAADDSFHGKIVAQLSG